MHGSLISRFGKRHFINSSKFWVKLNIVVLFSEFDESETLNRVSLSDIMNTEEDVQIKPRKEINNSSRVMRYF